MHAAFWTEGILERAETMKEAARTHSVKEAVTAYLSASPALGSDGCFPGNRTPEQVADRLLEGLTLYTSERETGDFRQTVRRVIRQQHMTNEQAKTYLGLLGLILAEMTGVNSGAAHAADMEAMLQARMQALSDCTPEEQVERLLQEAPPQMRPALTRVSHMRLVQDALAPLEPQQRVTALGQLTAFFAERAYAVFVGAVLYEGTLQGSIGERPLSEAARERLDPAVFSVASACTLSVLDACSLEASGTIPMQEAEAMISEVWETVCSGVACLLGGGAFAGTILSTLALAELALDAAYGLAAAGILVAGYAAAVALLLGCIFYGVPVLEHCLALWQDRQYVKKLEVREAEAGPEYADESNGEEWWYAID